VSMLECLWRRVQDCDVLGVYQIEAWWINKFNEEGYKTFNATKPRITIAVLKEKFDDMVARQKQLSLI
jgi:hypothetical protein